jgi:hypothetical protein
MCNPGDSVIFRLRFILPSSRLQSITI